MDNSAEQRAKSRLYMIGNILGTTVAGIVVLVVGIVALFMLMLPVFGYAFQETDAGAAPLAALALALLDAGSNLGAWLLDGLLSLGLGYLFFVVAARVLLDWTPSEAIQEATSERTFGRLAVAVLGIASLGIAYFVDTRYVRAWLFGTPRSWPVFHNWLNNWMGAQGWTRSYTLAVVWQRVTLFIHANGPSRSLLIVVAAGILYVVLLIAASYRKGARHPAASNPR